MMAILLSSLLVEVASASHNTEQPCSYNRPDYSLEWGYDPETDRVIFSLRAKTDHEGFLTGIAFGNKKKKDFLGVYVEDGKLGVMDGHITHSGFIEDDDTDNADSINFDYDKGVVSAEIARTLHASESKDADLSGCLTFYFPSGGSIFGIKKKSGTKIGKTIEKKVCDIADKCCLNNDGERKSDAAEESKSASDNQCSFNGKDFTVEWHFNPSDETVIFDVDQDIAKGKKYTAIGIGTAMKELDVAIVLLHNGIFRAVNDYHANRYGIPKMDEVQNFKIHAENTSTDERTHIQLSRKITTDDEEDASLDGCVTLQFAINAGTYENEVKIGKHKHPPIAHDVCSIRSKCVLGFERNHSEPGERSINAPKQTQLSDEFGDSPNDNADGDSASEKQVLISNEELTTEMDSTPSDKVTTSSAQSDGYVHEADDDDQEMSENHKSATERKECPPNHEDLKICTNYFKDYYEKVAKWAKKHNETVESQNWKACSLLSKVAHVPTLCCNIYTDKCAGFIDDNST